MTKKAPKPDSPWHLLALLTLVGMGFSIHLVYLHVQVYLNPSYKSICNISKKINCETVAQSSYAVFQGMPVAVWGLIGYLVILLFVLIGYKRDTKAQGAAHGALSILLPIGFVSSATLAYISHVHIGSLCPSCIGTYVVNFLSPFLLLASAKQQERTVGASLGDFFSWLSNNISTVIVLAFIFAITWYSIASKPYWKTKAKKATPSTAAPSLPTGTEHGHHWIGAKDPRITIVEFADYQCPYCKIAHFNMRAVLDKHKDIIRLVHRHYPLDNACNPTIKRRFHPIACLLSRAAVCAGKQGAFWKMNDVLYHKGKKLKTKDDVIQQAIALKLDREHFTACIETDVAKQAVQQDIKEGMKRGLRGTPYFFMNGVKFAGPIPPEALQKALEKARKNPVLKASHATPARRRPPAHRHDHDHATHRTPAPKTAPTPRTKATPAPQRPAPRTRQDTPKRPAPTTRPAPTPRTKATPAPRRPAPRPQTPPTPRTKATPTPKPPAPRTQAPPTSRPTQPTSRPTPRR